MEENKQQKNQFIREEIREKPMNRKKLFMKFFVSAVCGAVFAIVAVFVFFISMPLWSPLIAKEETGQLSKEHVPDTEEETAETAETESAEQVAAAPQQSLSISDYQTLQNELYAIGNQGNRSIVTVTSVVSSTDWFENSYESEGQGSGVIIKETDSEILILTERKVITDPSRISVTFIDDSAANAVLKKYDGNTGIAVLSVSRSDVDESTLNAISIAEFGNSNSVTKGSIVLALGSPLGTNYSILIGNVTSTDNEISTIDHNYSIFTTDIVASQSGSGILINVNGQIIGMVMQD